MIDFEQQNELKARIKVFGIGGAGGNALNNMIQQDLGGVMFYAANTDAQALNGNLAPVKVQMGARLTSGLGAGGQPNVGRDAAVEDQSTLAEHLKDTDMVFITAGMGGGTGTGAAPVIAQLAREAGALTVGVVTKPFSFEGVARKRNAENGLKALSDEVDTLIVVPNDRLLDIADPGMTMLDAFGVADRVLYDAVKSISDIIVTPGLINVDFADVKAIMFDQGRALMGTGTASGENRAAEAAKIAISSPLLEDSDIEGATGILINVTGGPDMSLLEVNESASLVMNSAHEDANIIFGAVIDETMTDQIKITVVATGFDHTRRPATVGATRAAARSEVVSIEERDEVRRLLELDSAGLPSGSAMTEPPPIRQPAATARATTPSATTPPQQPQQQPRERKPRRPRIYNPFSAPGGSEYDTPTFARRSRHGSSVITESVPTSTREDDSEPRLF